MEYRRLQSAFQDEQLIAELKSYMKDIVRAEAADLALSGEDTSGVKPANSMIDRLFKQMFKDFAVKDKKDTKNPAF